MKLQNKVKQHTVYKNKAGKRLAGVTTIVKNLGWNTDALIAWARREALEGNDPDKIRDMSADIGTLAHYLCECDASGSKPDLSEYSQNHIEIAQKCFESYIEWKDLHKAKVIHSELSLVSEKYQFGGTIDMVYQSGGKTILGDIKTSSGIFAEMKVQVSAYQKLLEENGCQVDDVYILHLSKDGGFTPYKINKTDTYWDIFKHCLELNKLKKLI